METVRVSVRTAPGLETRYGLITPLTVEPGQNERVLFAWTEYSRVRQDQLSGLSSAAALGVIQGAGRYPFPLSRGVASRRAGR